MSAPSTYFAYPYWTQLLITIFVATRAPVLFARDLRYRTIVLYFARPVSRTRFVLTRPGGPDHGDLRRHRRADARLVRLRALDRQ
uniref:Uncharacterized protein n=1 Tax=Janibacter limosus TaxID=53458 RepID=A0AC61U666_9MICO|nr:hypothetical protein [Janibacter limosus]